MKLDFLQEVLSTVLGIIGYSDDKAVFVNNFSQICLQHTISNLLQSLSSDQQRIMQESHASLQAMPIDEQMKWVKTALGITNEQIEDLSVKTNQKLFEDYIKTITPTLSSTQKNNLNNFLQTL